MVDHHEEVAPATVVPALQARPPRPLGTGPAPARACVARPRRRRVTAGPRMRTQAAMADARAAGGADEAAPWHKRLFYYLDWLFLRDNAAGAEFAALQARARRAAPLLQLYACTAKPWW